MIYFASCFGTAFIIKIGVLIAAKTDIDQNFGANFEYSFGIIQIILKLVSISIIIATAIIVVKKLCNKTLREHDDGRAARGSTVDMYKNRSN